MALLLGSHRIDVMDYIDEMPARFQRVRTPVDAAVALLRERAGCGLEPTISACERAMRAERDAVDSMLTTLQRRLHHLEETNQIQRTVIVFCSIASIGTRRRVRPAAQAGRIDRVRISPPIPGMIVMLAVASQPMAK